MKKMAFLLPAMRMGGAEKIALTFIKQLKSLYDVTIVLNQMEGDLLYDLPPNSIVKEDRLLSFAEIVKSDLRHLSFQFLWKDFLYYWNIKFGKNSERNYRYLVSRSPWNLGQFDIAIGYVTNVSTQIFSLADRVEANLKVAWIHGETNALKDTKLFEQIYHSFDHIFCVSKISKAHFLGRFPSCKEKTEVYYNPIDREAIIRDSEKPMEHLFSNDSFNIVSVGRLSPEKGFSMVPEILKILQNNGETQAHWYLVGDGPERDLILQKAKENGVSQMITMLGTLKNPYPYMKVCDLYVQPSFEEGYSTTICEAGILGRPIVGTKTSGGIYEQVEDRVSALLAEPNVIDLADKILFLIDNNALREKLAYEASRQFYMHNEELNKIRILFGE